MFKESHVYIKLLSYSLLLNSSDVHLQRRQFLIPHLQHYPDPAMASPQHIDEWLYFLKTYTMFISTLTGHVVVTHISNKKYEMNRANRRVSGQ